MQETLKKNSEIKDEKIQALETRYSVFVPQPPQPHHPSPLPPHITMVQYVCTTCNDTPDNTASLYSPLLPLPPPPYLMLIDWLIGQLVDQLLDCWVDVTQLNIRLSIAMVLGAALRIFITPHPLIFTL